MGRGSPLRATLRERIISQFKDNVPQRKTANNSDISPSTVHNIVKIFRESGEILGRKGQGRKLQLNARDHRAPRRYCLRNRHSTMMDIATWAREYFGKSLSLNTVRLCIKKCYLKLHYAKRKEFINFVQKRRQVLWAWSHLRWTERQWERVLWSDESTFQLVFGKNGTSDSMYQRWKRPTNKIVTNEKCKNQPLWSYGGASSAYIRRYHWCGGLCWNFGETCCRQDDDFSQEQQGNARPHSAWVTTAWLRRHRVRVLDWPASSPDLSPTEMYGASWRGERWFYPVVNMPLFQLFWSVLQVSISTLVYNRIMFISEKKIVLLSVKGSSVRTHFRF